MADVLKERILQFARVPPEPHVPEGSRESVRVFRAGQNYYNLLIVKWVLVHLIPLVVLAVTTLGGVAVASRSRAAGGIWLSLEGIVWLLFLLSLALSFLILRLNYELRWYIVTDRSLRIRSGIIIVQEVTMTFANIQDIRVTANPLERLLGLANVEVHSAGGSSSTAHGGRSNDHVGKFAGVDNASAIRDLMVDRLRAYKDSGLGEKSATVESPSSTAVDEARNVLSEARALREVLAAGGHN